MKILLNLLFAVIAFIIARTALALVGIDEAVGWLISVIVAIIVFFQDFAERISR